MAIGGGGLVLVAEHDARLAGRSGGQRRCGPLRVEGGAIRCEPGVAVAADLPEDAAGQAVGGRESGEGYLFACWGDGVVRVGKDGGQDPQERGVLADVEEAASCCEPCVQGNG
ncbi:hypothetical protein GCM10010329_61490 [Streptomyces spiroverticillatus]|nr:hypothetical protein GCM10010329_61490 [Streptomyces spiroverticillatus]